MNNDRLWQIDSYLLGDPTLDRQAFEQLMLDDPALALQVVEAAERLELLTKVASQTSLSAASTLTISDLDLDSQSAPQSTITESSLRSSRRMMLAVMITTAAALLIALIPTQFNRGNSRLDEVAINWLALESEVSSDSDASLSITTSTMVDTDIVPADSEISSPALAANDGTSSENGSNEDWLLDTAVIFFSDSGL